MEADFSPLEGASSAEERALGHPLPPLSLPSAGKFSFEGPIISGQQIPAASFSKAVNVEPSPTVAIPIPIPPAPSASSANHISAMSVSPSPGTVSPSCWGKVGAGASGGSFAERVKASRIPQPTQTTRMVSLSTSQTSGPGRPCWGGHASASVSPSNQGRNESSVMPEERQGSQRYLPLPDFPPLGNPSQRVSLDVAAPAAMGARPPHRYSYELPARLSPSQQEFPPLETIQPSKTPLLESPSAQKPPPTATLSPKAPPSTSNQHKCEASSVPSQLMSLTLEICGGGSVTG